MGKYSYDNFTYIPEVRGEFAKLGVSDCDWSLLEIIVCLSSETRMRSEIKRICIKATGMSERTVNRSFIRLEKLGLIRRGMRIGDSLEYHLDKYVLAKMPPLTRANTARVPPGQNGGMNGKGIVR